MRTIISFNNLFKYLSISEGEQLHLFVSITDTNRKVTPPPGRLVPITYQEVYIITLAQLTYEEYQDMNSKNT